MGGIRTMTRKGIERYILEAYGCNPEYLWLKFPGYAVFRHKENRKWFALVMDLSKKKLGFDSDEIIDVMNIKCDPVLIGSLIMDNGFFPAYHMNKNYWITVSLDGSVDEEQIKMLIDMSFELTGNK